MGGILAAAHIGNQENPRRALGKPSAASNRALAELTVDPVHDAVHLPLPLGLRIGKERKLILTFGQILPSHADQPNRRDPFSSPIVEERPRGLIQSSRNIASLIQRK